MAAETASGTKFSLVDSTNRADIEVVTDFDDTVTVRFGVEYVMLPKKNAKEFVRGKSPY